jgi:TRAP-type C4-dicarboxylate transport system substrate-binding protein
MYPVAEPMERFPWHNGLIGTGGFGQLWMEWMEEHSGGRLDMEIAEPGAIVAPADMLSACTKGTLDFIAHGWAGMWSGTVPEGNVEIGMPFAWETPAEFWDSYYNWGLKEIFEEVYAEQNVWPHIWANGDVYTFYANFDCSDPRSIEGKKMRAYGVYGKMIEALGASPASIAGADLYMALKLGTVDGAIYGMSGLWDMKHQEVVKYFVSEPNFTTIGCTFYVNLDSLNALPDDLKQMILEDSKYVTCTYVNQYSTAVNYYMNQAVGDGYCQRVKWTGDDRAYIYEKGIGLWDEIAALSPRTKQLVDIVKAQAREAGKIE